MLPAHVGASRSSVAALQREFARLRVLKHPHIARLLELGSNGQQYYVRGEHLDGEPLRDVLAHLLPERLEVGEADDIVRAIGSALVYAHERGIVHGEVRADNVLVTMDRRVVLANFLARSVARNATRPARPADDLRGLAKLAAELYTGSPSPQALRGAAHGQVPAARLNAIRSVLEAPQNRRPVDVAAFLAAAGLSHAPAPPPERRAARPQRSWSLWRLVLPMAAAVAVGTLVATYYATGEEWRESAAELQRRGLDALRAVTARAASTAPAASTSASVESAPAPAENAPAAESAPAATAATTHRRDPAATAAAVPQPTEAAPAPPASATPTANPPAAAPAPVAAPAHPTPEATPRTASRGGAQTAQPPPAQDPAVLSLGVTRIAAREDHSVVAIEVVRSGDTTREAAVGWWTSPDTAHENDDYASVGSRTVTFPAGATVERVLIPIVDDGIRESDERFTVHLSRPRNGVPGSVTATQVTLYDDD
jgi:hypothetical protein